MQPMRRTSRRKQFCVRTVALRDSATRRGSGHGWFESRSVSPWIMGAPARRRELRETAWATDLPKPTAEDIAASNEFGRRLQDAMAALSEKSRLVLLLTSMDGHSLEEVAELLQLPVGTVKSRLHSARKQLAEKLR